MYDCSYQLNRGPHFLGKGGGVPRSHFCYSSKNPSRSVHDQNENPSNMHICNMGNIGNFETAKHCNLFYKNAYHI